MSKMTRKSAIAAINRHGLLLTFPIRNAAEPKSLWSVAYPESEMRWEWDESGDDRVSKLWALREELSRSQEVVYTKWFRGRATFFSRELFTAMLSKFLHARSMLSLSRESREILESLECDSPLSTKTLKKACGLQGRFNESTYTRALKALWSRLLIVGYGEIDEGAFPSLAIGASKLMFEDLYEEALLNISESDKRLETYFKTASPEIRKFYTKVMSELTMPL